MDQSHPDWSPILINGETYAMYKDNEPRTMAERQLARVQTEKSDQCKKCIDDNNNWCPTINYTSGYCCSEEDFTNCPSQGICSTDPAYVIKELKYMLCPNEECVNKRYLVPTTDGSETKFEMLEGTFLVNDMCNYKITNPNQNGDLNDVMYFRLEYIERATAILIKGESLENPYAMYTLQRGQEYTALRGIDFFLLFIATETSSGDFIFSIWYEGFAGFGEEDPGTVTQEDGTPEDTGNNDNTGDTTNNTEDTQPDTSTDDTD